MAKKKKALPKKRASRALAVRPKKAPVGTVTISGMPPVPVGQLGELATVGALGLAELKLTAAEDKVLSRAVDPSQILLKQARRGEVPTIPYLPHIVYTRWFNDAFGRTGWSIVPTAAPKKVDNLVLVPYLLYVHGIPVAAATGEQEYIETNKQQTYGDVIESTVASALRRCAKRLGVGLEMWDKAWLQANVPILRKAATVGRREDVIDVEYQIEDPPSGQPETITAKQLGRLKEIVERVGRQPEEVSLYLKKNFNVARASKLLQKDYTRVCKALEARGDLPLPGDGQ